MGGISSSSPLSGLGATSRVNGPYKMPFSIEGKTALEVGLFGTFGRVAERLGQRNGPEARKSAVPKRAESEP
jgi:hypothetical protein